MIKNRKLLLVITILVILSSIFLQSCVITKKQQDRFCAKCHPVSDSISDKEKTTITKRDTSIDVAAKEGPEVDIPFTVEYDTSDCMSCCRALEALKNTPPTTKKKNGITLSIKTDGKKLTITCNEEAYKIIAKNAITERDIYKEHFEKLVYKEICQLRHHTGYDQVCDFGFPIILFLIGLWLYIKIRYGPYTQWPRKR